MFFYLFSIFSNSNNTKIYNSDNSLNFIDLELGLKENSSLSSSLSQKNNKFFPTIIIN